MRQYTDVESLDAAVYVGARHGAGEHDVGGIRRHLHLDAELFRRRSGAHEAQLEIRASALELVEDVDEKVEPIPAIEPPGESDDDAIQSELTARGGAVAAFLEAAHLEAVRHDHEARARQARVDGALAQ